MAEYGVTKTGLNIKRLDVIKQEMHEDLTEGWGVNTQLNPESFLNVLITNIADKIAELWEFGAGIYYAMYPSTAEGQNLDFAAQYGGSTRALAARSYYPVHCKGTDGTTLAAGTTIATSTSPRKLFVTTDAAKITRGSFNEAAITCSSVAAGAYTISLNGTVYKYTASGGDTAASILSGLNAAITGTGFTHSVEDGQLLISAVDRSSNNVMLLSDNLTTAYVISIITFASSETGDIVQPDGTITEIVTAVAGLAQVWNEGNYIAGRLTETDAEFRASYIGKIYSTSSRMCNSIVSALLNVQGVASAAAFENYTNYTILTYTMTGSEVANASYYFLFEGIYYSFTMPSGGEGDLLTFSTESKKLVATIGGTESEVTLTMSLSEPGSGTELTESFISEIYPHSIEAVVDGGSDSEVAKAILDTKSGGINTYGSVEVQVPDAYDGSITVRFNRPTGVYIWYNVIVYQSADESLPPNYDKLIEDIILDKMAEFSAGQDVTPQKWMTDIYKAVTGVAYIDIFMAATTESTAPATEETFSGNGSTKVFTLTGSPTAIYKVTVGGTEVTNYTYNSSTRKLTFTTAPPSGTNNIAVDYILYDLRTVTINNRQKAVSDEGRIGVSLHE